MIVTLSVPDDLHARYTEMSPTSPHKGMVKQLERFSDYGFTDRCLIFNKEQRQRLEKLFGQGIDAASVDRFLLWLEARSQVNVASLTVPLSTAQMATLQTTAALWAAKGGRVPEGQDAVGAYLETTVGRTLRDVVGG